MSFQDAKIGDKVVVKAHKCGYEPADCNGNVAIIIKVIDGHCWLSFLTYQGCEFSKKYHCIGISIDDLELFVEENEWRQQGLVPEDMMGY